jgi:hypothetical protein
MCVMYDEFVCALLRVVASVRGAELVGTASGEVPAYVKHAVRRHACDHWTHARQSMACPLAFSFSLSTTSISAGCIPRTFDEAVKLSMSRPKRNHAFYINSNHINATQGRQCKTVQRAWSEQRSCYQRRVYTSTRTFSPPTSTPTPTRSLLEVGRRLHRRLHGALSRQGVIHNDIHTKSPPTRDGGHIKFTSTSTIASSTSFKRRRSEAILHRHVLLR